MTDDGAVAATWRTSAWREEATEWLDLRLADAGLERAGGVTQPHLEPWSTVLTTDTSGGRVWLKAMVPGTTFEIELYDLLVRLDPEHVLHPIASDRTRGWLLLPDGGPSIADRLSGSELVSAMVKALPQYASLQRSLAPHAATLIDIGLFDLRPEGLAHLYRSAVTRLDGQPFAGALRTLEPEFGVWSEMVLGSPLPATLDHNDLHPWNILGLGSFSPDHRSKALFYDWGDSVVAHPLGSADIPISRVRRMARLDPGSAEVSRMRDAYLEVFTDLAPRRHLIELYETSCRLARATRSVIWDGSAEDIRRYLADR